MKTSKIIILAMLINLGMYTTAQVSINTDGSIPDPSAILDVNSTNKGMLVPRMSEEGIAAIDNPAIGLMVFNTDNNRLYCYDNGASEWKEMAIGSGTITPAQPWNCGEVITDERDGNSYNTVLIGSQCWMAENLNIGTMISGSNDQTNNTEIEKYCYENNTSNCDTYGGLYQWDEMMQYITTESTQGICPTGWHLPSNVEWVILSDFLGGAGVAGGKLKESGTNHWASPNTGGTNESSFYALPGGFRYGNDMFFDIGEIAYLWTSNMNDNTKSYGYYLYYNLASLSSYNDDKSRGNSVRCLMD